MLSHLKLSQHLHLSESCLASPAVLFTSVVPQDQGPKLQPLAEPGRDTQPHTSLARKAAHAPGYVYWFCTSGSKQIFLRENGDVLNNTASTALPCPGGTASETGRVMKHRGDRLTSARGTMSDPSHGHCGAEGRHGLHLEWELED